MRSKSIDFAWRVMKPRQAPKGESCALSPLETPKLCPRGKPMGKSFYYGFFFTARKIFSKPFLILLFLLAFWEFCIIIFQTPSYILPSPWAVLTALKQQRALLYFHTLPTFEELLFGFLFGALFGITGALLLAYSKPARLWFLPLLLISQSLPTFAIAPVLVVWFGYGMAAKIIITMIMIFFPITNAFYDGLKNTKPAWNDLGCITQASTFRFYWHIKIPAALPSLATGLRVAAALAPIGAIVGEWVGANRTDWC